MHAAGSLQVCAGQEAEAEATIRAMYDIYNDEHSEAAARLFAVGGKEILSKEETTQGDPTSMGTDIYDPTSLPHFLHELIIINEHRTKEVAFADDLTVAEKIKEIKQYWEPLLQVDPKYGYYPKPSKSHLIVKEEHFDRAKFIF